MSAVTEYLPGEIDPNGLPFMEIETEHKPWVMLLADGVMHVEAHHISTTSLVDRIKLSTDEWQQVYDYIGRTYLGRVI